MRSKLPFLIGLAVALVAVTFPLWYSAVAGSSDPMPQLKLPSGCPHCIEDAAYMRAHHMQLLEKWRTDAVREGKRTYTSNAYHQAHKISLTGTCMACHQDRREFCDRCHAYAGVRVTCWDCHTDAKGR